MSLDKTKRISKDTLLCVSKLVFEVTRKCSAKCLDCAKGKSQHISMTSDMVDAFFINHRFGKVKDIVITGGEITLNVPVVSRLIDYLIAHEVPFETCRGPINGLIYDPKLIKSFEKLAKEGNVVKKEGSNESLVKIWVSYGKNRIPKPIEDVVAAYNDLNSPVFDKTVNYRTNHYALGKGKNLPDAKPYPGILTPESVEFEYDFIGNELHFVKPGAPSTLYYTAKGDLSLCTSFAEYNTHDEHAIGNCLSYNPEESSVALAVRKRFRDKIHDKQILF